MKTTSPTFRALLLTFALIAANTTGLAQTTLKRVLLSGDIHAQLVAADGSLVTGSDQAILDFDPESGEAALFAELQAINASLDLDALGLDPEEGAIFSVDTATTIAGMNVRPRDVLEESGTGLAFAFVGGEQGVPDGVSVDAVSQDLATGDLLLSFDRTFTLPAGLEARLVGVFRFDGSGFSSEFAGSTVPENANLDAVHLMSNGNVLMSFDIDVVLPGESGSFHAADDDIVEYDPATGNFTRVAFRLRDIDDSWQAADVDAVWADDINGGKVRFTESFRQVQEDTGTLVLTLERFEAAESPLSVEVTSIDGSATTGDGDYVEVSEVVTWDDSELGQKQVIVEIIDDDTPESTTESFEARVEIGMGFATLANPSVVTIEIIDNDGDRIFADGFES